jgi:hypothetical protein
MTSSQETTVHAGRINLILIQATLIELVKRFGPERGRLIFDRGRTGDLRSNARAEFVAAALAAKDSLNVN